MESKSMTEMFVNPDRARFFKICSKDRRKGRKGEGRGGNF
jgi:hypothetical protein